MCVFVCSSYPKYLTISKLNGQLQHQLQYLIRMNARIIARHDVVSHFDLFPIYNVIYMG